MNDETIKNLLEALKHSPDNIPLRLHLAESYYKLNFLDEAEREFSQVLLNQKDNERAKYGLALVYFRKQEYSTSSVILEEIIDMDPTRTNALMLYAKALVGENKLSEAKSIYQRVISLDPNMKDQELDEKFRISGMHIEPDPDLLDEDAKRFLERPSINFQHVGGMENVKKEIELKIIQPLIYPELYKAYGKKVGGGILLYGPPGCGKTYLAKATAGQIDAKFINVGLNDILDMWIGNSEKNLHEIFEIARHSTPCVLCFDEIDALGASRSDMKQSAGRQLINQFLQELDGVEFNNEGILIIGATNAPWHLDPAFKRPGRFDRIIFVPPPDEKGRESIFNLKLEGKPVGQIDFQALAKRTAEFSGADIEAAIDIAIEQKLEDSFKSGFPEPISSKDLMKACKKHKPSTKDWFLQAKNFALYANESGLYDEILDYLKIKK